MCDSTLNTLNCYFFNACSVLKFTSNLNQNALDKCFRSEVSYQTYQFHIQAMHFYFYAAYISDMEVQKKIFARVFFPDVYVLKIGSVENRRFDTLSLLTIVIDRMPAFSLHKD